MLLLFYYYCIATKIETKTNGLKIEAYPCSSNLGFNLQLFFLIC